MAASEAGCGVGTAAALLQRLYATLPASVVADALRSLPGALSGGVVGAPVMGTLLDALCAMGDVPGAPHPTDRQRDLLRHASKHGAGHSVLRTLLRDVTAGKETDMKVVLAHLAHVTAEVDDTVVEHWRDAAAEDHWDRDGSSCPHEAWSADEESRLAAKAATQSAATRGQGWAPLAHAHQTLIAAFVDSIEPGSAAAVAAATARREAAAGVAVARLALEARQARLCAPGAVVLRLHAASPGAPHGCPARHSCFQRPDAHPSGTRKASGTVMAKMPRPRRLLARSVGTTLSAQNACLAAAGAFGCICVEAHVIRSPPGGLTGRIARDGAGRVTGAAYNHVAFGIQLGRRNGQAGGRVDVSRATARLLVRARPRRR